MFILKAFYMRYLHTYDDTAGYESDRNKAYPHVGFVKNPRQVIYTKKSPAHDIEGTLTTTVSGLQFNINQQPVNAVVDGTNFYYDWDGGDITSLSGFCYNTSNSDKIESIQLRLDTSKCTNFWRMFQNMSALKSVDVSALNTEKVTEIRSMFDTTTGITEVDLSAWNTSSVTNIQNAFINMNSLTALNISNWDLSKARSVTMFYGTNGLTITMNNTNQETFDFLKTRLPNDGATTCTIIRDGVTWVYYINSWVVQ